MSVVSPNVRPGSMAQQRRSQRVLLSVPVIVSGEHAGGAPFEEHTRTLVVNAHGALILLREHVLVGQVLNVTHRGTGVGIECTVKDINAGQHGKAEVGIEFVQANPGFWKVWFPPADWSRSSPEAKRFDKRGAQPAISPEVKK